MTDFHPYSILLYHYEEGSRYYSDQLYFKWYDEDDDRGERGVFDNGQRLIWSDYGISIFEYPPGSDRQERCETKATVVSRAEYTTIFSEEDQLRWSHFLLENS